MMNKVNQDPDSMKEVTLDLMSCSKALNYVLNEHIIPKLSFHIDREVTKNFDLNPEDRYLTPQLVEKSFFSFLLEISKNKNIE